eukprot:scaffold9174_cov139-Isochrysis_galbana.AAC.1
MKVGDHEAVEVGEVVVNPLLSSLVVGREVARQPLPPPISHTHTSAAYEGHKGGSDAPSLFSPTGSGRVFDRAISSRFIHFVYNLRFDKPPSAIGGREGW